MKITLSEAQRTSIKQAFQNMQTMEHLLDLLNGVFLLHKMPAKELINLNQLNFFCTSFNWDDKKRKRYKNFYVRKRSGNLREIKAPVTKLKQIQTGINIALQTVYTIQEHAYGFVQGKSIVDNAIIHAGSNFILNVDIKDFFPSIQFRKIKIILERPPFGLSSDKEPLAFCIANLCTDDGVLPQGAPTSPILSNIVCQDMDERLIKLAQGYEARYSRYADDITFSSNSYIFTRRFFENLVAILKSERFELNIKKTRVQSKAFRQEVTGLTVNEKVNINRKYLRSYRTLNHLYETKGPEAALEYHFKRMPFNVREQKFNKPIIDPESYIKRVIKGKYSFISMVKGDTFAAPKKEIDPY